MKPAKYLFLTALTAGILVVIIFLAQKPKGKPQERKETVMAYTNAQLRTWVLSAKKTELAAAAGGLEVPVVKGMEKDQLVAEIDKKLATLPPNVRAKWQPPEAGAPQPVVVHETVVEHPTEPSLTRNEIIDVVRITMAEEYHRHEGQEAERLRLEHQAHPTPETPPTHPSETAPLEFEVKTEVLGTSVFLDWSDIRQVYEWWIYRTDGKSPMEQIGRVHDITSYVDQDLSPGTYAYKIVGVDNDGRRYHSKRTSTVVIKPTTIVPPPNTPTETREETVEGGFADEMKRIWIPGYSKKYPRRS